MSGQNADEKPIAFSEPEKPILDSISGINFRISDEHLGEGSPKQKFRANMDAIHMLKKRKQKNGSNLAGTGNSVEICRLGRYSGGV